MLTLIEWTAILSALAGISATVFVIIQLKHMDKHRDLEITMKLFEWVETDRLRNAIRWIETDFEFENYERYKANIKNNYQFADYPYQVEAFFEQVGFLVNKNFIDIDVIVDRLGGYIITIWKKLEPWIRATRIDRQDKTFGEHFQKLYEKTIVYMREGHST